MSQTTRIYIELSADLQQVMLENGLSIDDILREQDLDVRVEYAAPPVNSEPQTSRSRDPMTVIVASALLVHAIGAAVSKVLNTIHQQPVKAVVRKAEEVHYPDGSYSLKTEETPLLLQPEQHTQESLSAGIGDVVSMQFTSEHRQ